MPEIAGMPPLSQDQKAQILTDWSNTQGNPIDFAEKLNPQDVQRDIQVLFWALSEAQTSLYRYADSLAVQNAFFKAWQRAGQPLTYLEVIREIAQIQHVIACGHSSWGHSKAFRVYRNENLQFFPFDLHVLDNRLYIAKNYSESPAIVAFSEIHRINGESPTSIIAELKKYMTHDGASAPNGLLGIEQFFTNAYSNFIDTPSQFELEIQAPGDEAIQSLKVDALSKSEIDSIKRIRYPSQQPPSKPLKLDFFENEKAAILTISSFRNEVIAHFEQDFNEFILEAFAQLKARNYPYFVIDLRGNTGGWTANGRELFRYFIEKEMAYVREVSAKKTGNYSFAPLVAFEAGYSDTMQWVSNAKQHYIWQNYPSLIATPTDGMPYPGSKTYLLTDDMSCSCSSIFSSMMAAHTEATFVGLETGGAQCGSNGMVMGITLPYTQIPIQFSTAKYEMNVPDLDNHSGVEPEFIIPTTIENRKNGTDAQLSWVLAHIRKEIEKE